MRFGILETTGTHAIWASMLKCPHVPKARACCFFRIHRSGQPLKFPASVMMGRSYLTTVQLELESGNTRSQHFHYQCLHLLMPNSIFGEWDGLKVWFPPLWEQMTLTNAPRFDKCSTFCLTHFCKASPSNFWYKIFPMGADGIATHFRRP